ncbi:MAG: oligosaccharide flippase family protein [Bacilli bacterium]|nr:oligosaccharide flippase family protein [Bacilli bacterium]MDD4795365.1 oligosaccharide flippase family protein [Bacilli bacterium]
MKNKFIRSSLILMVGAALTKIFSFFIRIYFTRIIGPDGIDIYSIIMPTFSLLIAITQLGFPIAISHIIAKGEKRGKNVILSVIPISILLNIFLICITVISAHYLSHNLLHEPRAEMPLICLSLVLPFISISSIIRGYFFGKQQMLPHTLSNIVEQVIKLIIVLFLLPHLLKYGTIIAVSGYILINIISEIISIIIFLLFLPKKFTISKEDIKPDLGTIKEVLGVGLPSVGSRIIGNIGFFFEPIMLTFIMMLVGYESSYIISEYAIYNTYVIGLLIVPTFFITSLSTAIIPEVSKYSHNKIKVKRIFKKVMFLSLILGIATNIFIFVSAEFILKLIFNTTKGVTYIKVLAPFFILYYLEAPMASILQALGYAKHQVATTTIGIIVKLTMIILLSLLKIGIYSLIFAEVFFILIVVILNYLQIKKILRSS